jgi:FG-GAP repeat
MGRHVSRVTTRRTAWGLAALVLVASPALGGCATKSAGRLTNSTQPTTTTAKPAGKTAAPVQLLASDGQAGDNLGGAVWYDTFNPPIKPNYYATPGETALSSDGNVGIVGASGHAIGSKLGAGAAYVYARTGGKWAQVARLSAGSPQAYAAFGWVVAISGDGTDALIGAPYTDVGKNVDQGTAYFFHQRSGKWSLVGEVQGPTPAAYDAFGWSVAISRDGSTAIIGASSRTVGAFKAQGEAYVYRKTGATWTRVQTLVPQAGHESAEFGGAVALSADGSYAAVTEASHLDSQRVYHGGATYIFNTADAWKHAEQLARFADPNLNADHTSDAYGVNVVLSDDGKLAAVAAPDVFVNNVGGAGVAYVYETTGTWRRSSTNTTRTIAPAQPVPFGYYGSSVALSADGTLLYIGLDGVGSNDQGGADLVKLQRGAPATTKPVVTSFAAPNPDKGRFGTAVSISADGTTVLSSAPWLTIGGAANRGAAYIVTLPSSGGNP